MSVEVSEAWQERVGVDNAKDRHMTDNQVESRPSKRSGRRSKEGGGDTFSRMLLETRSIPVYDQHEHEPDKQNKKKRQLDKREEVQKCEGDTLHDGQ